MNDLSKVNTSRLKIDEIREDVLNTSRTNCITEIPQDIKLELNKGDSTLYAWVSYSSTIYTKTLEITEQTKFYDAENNDVSTNYKLKSVESNYFEANVTGTSGTEPDVLFERNSSSDLVISTGVLILKAGSKVYVPNGFEEDGTTPRFDEVVIEGDIITTGVSFPSSTVFVVYVNGVIVVKESSQIASGSTPPSSGSVTDWWYDTTNNVIKETTDWNTWSVIQNCSFPVCLVTLQLTAPYITSINQILNGFGYIGSTVFALPGVRGLIPDGRNADGNLKNIEFVTSKVSTIQVLDGTISFGIKFDGETGDYVVGIYGEDVYDDELNIMSYQGVVYSWMYSGNLVFLNNSITSFTPKTPFQALDYNNKETIVAWGMPDYSAGVAISTAGGGTYTVPQNGYIKFTLGYSGSNAVRITDTNSSGIEMMYIWTPNNSSATSYLPVTKNQIIYIFERTGTVSVVFYPAIGG